MNLFSVSAVVTLRFWPFFDITAEHCLHYETKIVEVIILSISLVATELHCLFSFPTMHSDLFNVCRFVLQKRVANDLIRTPVLFKQRQHIISGQKTARVAKYTPYESYHS